MTEFSSPHEPNDESPPTDDAVDAAEAAEALEPTEALEPAEALEPESVPVDATPVYGEDELLEAANAPLEATPEDVAPNDAPLIPDAAPEITDTFVWSDAEPSPATEEPIAEDPVAEEPAAEDPADEQPAAEEPAAEEPGPTTPPPPPGGPTAPPQYGPASVRRVYRSRHDRKIGGVSAGIAEFFRIDPTIVRLATLVFAITGVGILVYIAAWFIIPIRPEGFVDAPRTAPLANDRTMTLAFGMAALALAFGIITGSWAVLAIALIGGGVWLLSEQTAMAPAASAPAANYEPHNYEPRVYEPHPYEPMPYATTAPMPAQAAPSYAAASPPPPTWPETPPVIRERKPQRVTWVVLSLLALLTAVGISAAAGDWFDVSATLFLSMGIIAIAVGVVVGQIRGGGARGLIPLGILAALALFPVSAVDGLIGDGVGDSVYRPNSIAELQDSYDHGIGQLTVDLSRVDLSGSDRTIDIDLGIGELIVIVSEETGGQAVLQAKAGEVSHQLPNTDSFLFDEGVNIETGTVLLQGENGSLDLNIDVGLGTAELRSVPGR